MKRQTVWGVIFVGCVTVAGLGTGCAKPNTQQTLQAFYDEQATALNEQNINKAYAHFAPDCVFVGEQNRSYGLVQERAEITRTLNQAKSKMTFSSSITSITPKTSSATEVTVSVTRRITSTILWRKTMQPAPVEIKAEIRDFWVKGANGWQVKREKIETPQMTIDGKPFSLTQPGN